MTKSTWKSERAYMDCHKWVYSLQTNYLNNVWLDTDTSNNPTRQAFGNMSVAPSGSTYVWIISESNILDASTFNTYTMRYERKHTKFLKIWKVPSIAALS
jgi:hypothetical protein